MKDLVLRVPLVLVMAAGVTFLLFMMMFRLVSPDSSYEGGLEPMSGIRFGPIEIPDDPAERSRRRPPEHEPPTPPPSRPRMNLSRPAPQAMVAPRLDIPDLEVPLVSGSGLYLGEFQRSGPTAEGDVIPVVVIRPMYPREAALSGIEGWVKVEFTITESGAVRNARVIDAQPARVFDREAIRAILKWKFKPRIINGVAVERLATQTIDFALQGPHED